MSTKPITSAPKAYFYQLRYTVATRWEPDWAEISEWVGFMAFYSYLYSVMKNKKKNHVYLNTNMTKFVAQLWWEKERFSGGQMLFAQSSVMFCTHLPPSLWLICPHNLHNPKIGSQSHNLKIGLQFHNLTIYNLKIGSQPYNLTIYNTKIGSQLKISG